MHCPSNVDISELPLSNEPLSCLDPVLGTQLQNSGQRVAGSDGEDLLQQVHLSDHQVRKKAWVGQSPGNGTLGYRSHQDGRSRIRLLRLRRNKIPDDSAAGERIAGKTRVRWDRKDLVLPHDNCGIARSMLGCGRSPLAIHTAHELWTFLNDFNLTGGTIEDTSTPISSKFCNPSRRAPRSSGPS